MESLCCDSNFDVRPFLIDLHFKPIRVIFILSNISEFAFLVVTVEVMCGCSMCKQNIFTCLHTLCWWEFVVVPLLHKHELHN